MDDYRSLLRRVKSNLFEVNPMDSFPFISGDGYRLRCDVDLTNFSQKIDELLSTLDPNKKHSIFVGGEEEGYLLLHYLTKESLRTSWNLFFHNRDVAPSNQYLFEVIKRVNKVFSQGWIGEHKSIFAIPSGLENACKLRNGVISDYLHEIEKGLESQRAISVFVSFKEANNLQERKHLKKLFSKIEGSYVPNEPINPKRYRKALFNSKYVISPPGNGPDCHRTWESIYLGAIPVVLRKFWAFENEGLNVLVVDSWEEAHDYILGQRPMNPNLELNQPKYLWERFVGAYL